MQYLNKAVDLNPNYDDAMTVPPADLPAQGRPGVPQRRGAEGGPGDGRPVDPEGHGRAQDERTEEGTEGWAAASRCNSRLLQASGKASRQMREAFLLCRRWTGRIRSGLRLAEGLQSECSRLQTGGTQWMRLGLWMDGPRGLSQMERVVNTFVAPTATFKDILRSTSWWLPFVLMVVSSTGSDGCDRTPGGLAAGGGEPGADEPEASRANWPA